MMLSKLLSKVGNSEAVTLQDGSKDGDKNGEGLDSSKKVFQSLLSALQGDGKGSDQKLVKLTGDEPPKSDEDPSSKEGKKLAMVLGGQFSSLKQSVDVEAKDLNAAKESVENIQVDTETGKPLQNPDAQIQGEKAGSEAGKNAKQENAEKETKETNKQPSQATGKATATPKGEKTITSDASKQNLNSKSVEKAQGNVDGKVAEQAEGKPSKGNATKTMTPEQVVQGSKEVPDKATAKKPAEGKAEPAKVLPKEASNTEVTKKANSHAEEEKQNKTAGQTNLTTDTDNAEKDKSVGKNLNVGEKQAAKSEPKTKQKDAPSEPKRTLQDLKNKQDQVEAKKLPHSQLKQKLDNSPRAKQPLNTERQTATQQTERRRIPVENGFQKNSTTGSDQKGLEFKSLQVEQVRKKQQRSNDKRSGKNKRGRNPELRGIGFSGRARQQSMPPLASVSSGGQTFSDSSSSAWQEDMVWEKQLNESSEMNEKQQETQRSSSASSTMRLGQVPVANISLRRQILPGLTKTLTQATSEAQKTPADQWQKHSFTLDDGKNIQLSVRESKGVLHVKMGSLNMDLSKLLQQNMQQIREHIEQEFGADVNLQFENQGQDSSEFAEDSDSSSNDQNYPQSITNNELASENTGQLNLESIRRFGYNQMEWTA